MNKFLRESIGNFKFLIPFLLCLIFLPFTLGQPTGCCLNPATHPCGFSTIGECCPESQNYYSKGIVSGPVNARDCVSQWFYPSREPAACTLMSPELFPNAVQCQLGCCCQRIREGDNFSHITEVRFRLLCGEAEQRWFPLNGAAKCKPEYCSIAFQGHGFPLEGEEGDIRPEHTQPADVTPAETKVCDQDGDGWCDPGKTARDCPAGSSCKGTDNCPTVSNPDQKDYNRNGFGDACDPLYQVRVFLKFYMLLISLIALIGGIITKRGFLAFLGQPWIFGLTGWHLLAPALILSFILKVLGY